MYRPEGWKNPINTEISPEYGNGQRWAFEQGADAMLKALVDKGVTFNAEKNMCVYPLGYEGITGKGTLVFIPDDKKEY